MNLLDSANSIIAGAEALRIVRESIARYVERCDEGRWDETEAARQRAKDALDAFFDHYASAMRGGPIDGR